MTDPATFRTPFRMVLLPLSAWLALLFVRPQYSSASSAAAEMATVYLTHDIKDVRPAGRARSMMPSCPHLP